MVDIFIFIYYLFLGAYYKVNFSPDWNFVAIT